MTSTTERTILRQYEYWLKSPQPQQVADRNSLLAVVGCGTSYNLAQSIAAASCAAGIGAVAIPSNEWLRRPKNYLPHWREATVLALSRSGESSETVATAQRSRDEGLRVVAVTCEAESSLSRLADFVLYTETDKDEGIVMTTSASLMLLNGLGFVGDPVDTNLAVSASRQLIQALDTRIGAMLAGIRHVVYLGAGAAYGIAVEGGLKLQEMSQVYTQAYHPLEYRHGPISLADGSTLVVILYSSEGLLEEASVAHDIQACGAVVLGIGGPGDVELPLAAAGSTRLLAMLPALQLLGERVATSRSLDTTSPRHLTKVVRLGELDIV
jgi:glutamine---fructose-6-phosphate transaminase (isomerizing)